MTCGRSDDGWTKLGKSQLIQQLSRLWSSQPGWHCQVKIVFYSWIFSWKGDWLENKCWLCTGQGIASSPSATQWPWRGWEITWMEFIVESQQVWKDRNSCEPDIGKPLYVQSWIYNIRRSLFRNANEEDKSRYFLVDSHTINTFQELTEQNILFQQQVLTSNVTQSYQM